MFRRDKLERFYLSPNHQTDADKYPPSKYDATSVRRYAPSMNAMCFTTKTGMVGCDLSRKRCWRNLRLNCLIQVSSMANTTTENRTVS